MNPKNKRESSVVMVVGSYYAARQRDDGIWVSDHARIKQNIYMAENVARMVMALNNLESPLPQPVLAVTPHKNTAHFEQLTDVSEAVYQSGDRDIIRGLASALITIPNYVISSGTSKEIALANDLGVPVFEELQSLRIFLSDPERVLGEMKSKAVQVRGLTVNIARHPTRTCFPLALEDVMFFHHLDDDCVPVRFYADRRGYIRGS